MKKMTTGNKYTTENRITPQAIYFDMDGTLADLEGVSDWQKKLDAEDSSPYSEAKPLVDMNLFDKLIDYLCDSGIKVGIISWGSIDSTRAFHKETFAAKKNWCDRHFDTSKLSEFHVIPYGTSKHAAADVKDSLLVDDNPEVCDSWNGCGIIRANGDDGILSKVFEAVR